MRDTTTYSPEIKGLKYHYDIEVILRGINKGRLNIELIEPISHLSKQYSFDLEYITYFIRAFKLARERINYMNETFKKLLEIDKYILDYDDKRRLLDSIKTEELVRFLQRKDIFLPKGERGLIISEMLKMTFSLEDIKQLMELAGWEK